jgi:hypothetical protein
VTSVPWAGRRHSFAGWVPNVHSHLSFSLIGVGRGPEVAQMTPAYADGRKRLACVLEARQTDDFAVPAFVTKWFRPGAMQWFLLVGTTRGVQTPTGISKRSEAPPRLKHRERLRRWLTGTSGPITLKDRTVVDTELDVQGMLVGRIHVMFHQKDAEYRARQAEFLDLVKDTVRSREDWLDEQLDEFPTRVAEQVRENCFGNVPLNFALFRTGEIRIWYDDDTAASLTKQQRVWIARQSYFFAKDMVHHHVHHDAKSDQITPLVEVGELPHEDGEEHWRRDTVWSMSRDVDSLARRGTLLDLREATGILAYADAFQKSLLLYRRRADDAADFEPNSVTYQYDYAHIRESLKVQIEQVSARRTLRAQMIVAGLAASIAATSLLLSLVGTHNSGITNRLKGRVAILPNVPEEAISWIASWWVVPAVACFLILYGFSEVLISEERIGASRGQVSKLAQLIRGAFNSIANRLGQDGAWVQRWLERFYLAAILSTLGGVAIAYGPVTSLGRSTGDILHRLASVSWFERTAPSPRAAPGPPGPQESGRPDDAQVGNQIAPLNLVETPGAVGEQEGPAILQKNQAAAPAANGQR